MALHPQPDSERIVPCFLTVTEMAEALHMHESTLYKQIASGTAPPYMRHGKRILFVLGPIFDNWCRARLEPNARGRWCPRDDN